MVGAIDVIRGSVTRGPWLITVNDNRGIMKWQMVFALQQRTMWMEIFQISSKNFQHLNMYGDEKMDWADQEMGVTCFQEEEHSEEMDWITSRNPNFCIWREREDDEDSL
ncbi:hypothetical protein J4Q44_G00284920 [Coregonus suidteri]|uniref:Uncharacterized protein n=1 Tax=Coregonus suidteri TaxID=861788 RepID=A0AAN8QD14_9TELE